MVTQSFIVDETELLTQLIEAAGAIGSIISGFRNLSIAQNYYNLYAAQRNFYYNTFQNGVEAPLVGYINGVSPYTENYGARTNTLFDGQTGPFGGNAGNLTSWWSRHAGMYATTPDPSITEAQVDIPRVQSDWINYMFRFEEYWYDTRNDIRWQQRLAVHNIGIKQGSAASSALDYGVANLQDNIQDMASQLATYANGAAQYAGYKRGLADVDAMVRSATNFSPRGLDSSQTKPMFGVGTDQSLLGGINSNWPGVPYQ